MDAIFELSKSILPVIIPCLFTFFITKYTYYKDVPLENLKIAYNRVYYPLNRIILDKSNSEEDIISKSKFYFDKYDKYIDMSTIRIYNFLCNCNNKTQKRNMCQRFKDNIYFKNSYLRRKLGYLEPNLFQLYKYSTPSKKSVIRLLIEFCAMYTFLVLGSFTMDTIESVYWICIYLTVTISLIFIIEIAICICRTVYYKIRK